MKTAKGGKRHQSLTGLQELRQRLLQKTEDGLPGRTGRKRKMLLNVCWTLSALALMSYTLYDLIKDNGAKAWEISALLISVAMLIMSTIHFFFILGPAREKIQEYTLLEKLGEGAFGEVYHAEHKGKNIHVALKFMTVEKTHYIDATIHEALRLQVCRHENIVKLVDMFMYYKQIRFRDRLFFERSPWSLCIALEYCDGGALRGKIQDWAKQASIMWLKPLSIRALFEHIASGMVHMHSKDLAHLDLKPDNILVSQGFRQVKICDLQQSSYGTDGYIAPERTIGGTMFEQPSFTRSISSMDDEDRCRVMKADVWSAGCVLLDVLMPKHGGGWALQEEIEDYVHEQEITDITLDQNLPYFEKEQEWDRYQKVLDIVFNNDRITGNAGINNLVTNCLVPNPAARWTSRELLEAVEGNVGF